MAVEVDLGPYDDIRAAFRLGWSVAEVRGRIRLGDDPILLRRDLPERHDGALPLYAERTPEEQHIEAMKVMAALGERCAVDTLVLPDAEVLPPDPGETPPALIRRLEIELERRRGAGEDGSALWERITEVFRLWDQHIQDTLASGPFGRASAYQLGRGLAETFWALDPSATSGDITSWQFLLGDGRREILWLLVDRLSFSMKAYTADAVKGSLGVWTGYVSATPHPPPGARRALMKQVTIWRDLLATDTDPLNLLPPRQGVLGASRILPVIRGFVWELVLFAFSIGILVLTAVLLGRGEKGGAVTAVLGVFGAGGAATVAVVKSATQDMGSQLRRAINRDLSTTASTTLHLRRRFGRVHAQLVDDGPPR